MAKTRTAHRPVFDVPKRKILPSPTTLPGSNQDFMWSWPDGPLNTTSDIWPNIVALTNQTLITAIVCQKTVTATLTFEVLVEGSSIDTFTVSGALDSDTISVPVLAGQRVSIRCTSTGTGLAELVTVQLTNLAVGA
jgi:hypothetical protein